MTKVTHDSETPAHNKQVITAAAFIHKTENNAHKVFLPKRALTKKFLPGVYELPGGHIDFGENIVEGLKREVLEEFQMNISVGDCFFTFDYVNKIKGSHSIEVIYFATFTDPESRIKINSSDHSEYLWATESDITSKIVTTQKPEDDIEIRAVLRGFELLRNKSLSFGN
ncbi:MAG: NUDIX domain-containing protein [Caldilineaceae bacterium]|nr:NUDIX domain-containing protein [Caldilineaceae bacterium]